MKVIFLDIDGVLNSQRSCLYYFIKYKENGFGGYFKEEKEEPSYRNVKWDPYPVKLLCSLGKQFPIVISSTWRKKYSVETFKKMFKLYSPVEVNIIGKTEDFNAKRGEQIQKYIEENGITNYVIIDDDADYLASQLGNFIQTDFKIGFTYKDYLKALMILKENKDGKSNKSKSS